MKEDRKGRNEVRVNVVTQRHNNVVPNQLVPDLPSRTVPGVKKPNKIHVPVSYVI